MAIVDRPRPQRLLSRGAAALAAAGFTVAAALTTVVAGPAAADTITDTIPVGTAPFAVAVSPDAARAYVTNGGDGTVSVIAIDQAPALSGTAPLGFVGRPYSHAFTVTGRPAPTVTVTAGTLPDGLTLSADGSCPEPPPPPDRSSSPSRHRRRRGPARRRRHHRRNLDRANANRQPRLHDLDLLTHRHHRMNNARGRHPTGVAATAFRDDKTSGRKNEMSCPAHRSVGSCGDRNTTDQRVSRMVTYSHRMVPEIFQTFWAGMAAGEFITDATAAAGTFTKQGTRWLAACGGVRPRRGRNLKGRCLTFAEREEIAIGIAAGCTLRDIAKALNRSPSTISREIARNSEPSGQYRARSAHAAAYRRASGPNRPSSRPTRCCARRSKNP
ncbi:helix-turn-helix domain-containing protein [Prescottella defluvii]|nr:helix-turn-helix domain-containing protein [Prescottella defluvii]